MEKQNGLGFLGALCAVVMGSYLTVGIPQKELEEKIKRIDEVTYRLDERSFNLDRTVGGINEKLNHLLQRPTLELKTENVLGNKTPEQFYEIAGERVYLTIDGQPVKHYFQK